MGRADRRRHPRGERIVTEGMLPPLGQKYLVGELEQILLDTSRGADASELVEAPLPGRRRARAVHQVPPRARGR
ncbi:hypothetical protein [Streptomyces sp. LN699]|uniref:hypothetical protein n=1 Tax=Streptomyces sp. LN699 TaxID=3112981 RepID=UPI00371F7FA3